MMPWAGFRAIDAQPLGPFQYYRHRRSPGVPVAIASTVSFELSRLAGHWRSGERVAILVGSRGIAGLSALVEAALQWCRSRRLTPVVVPAMGSHGGATAQGQTEVLRHLGIDPVRLGVDWDADMATDVVGTLDDGRSVHMAQAVRRVDRVLVLNRVKPHTSFRGGHESGLIKMLALGLGKQAGARTLHAGGYDHFDQVLKQAAQMVLKALGPESVVGLGTVEDADKQVVRLKGARGEALFSLDQELLEEARALMPSLPIKDLDVLVVVEMGKNISGLGIDPNITGRYSSDLQSQGPRIGRLVVLRLTAETGGNAIGVGLADVVPYSLAQAIDWEQTYTNGYTSGAHRAVKLPMVMASEEDAILAAANMPSPRRGRSARVAIIRNTLKPGDVWLSSALWEEAQSAGLEAVGDPEPLVFADGRWLTPEFA